MKGRGMMDIKRVKSELIKQKKSGFKGNIYHFSQVNFAYNSNKIEGSILTEDQTEAIFDTSSLIPKNDQLIRDLQDMLQNDRDKYIEFYKAFGLQLKVGVYNNWGMDKYKLQDLIMFYSVKQDKLVTFKDYVSSMAEGQKYIYIDFVIRYIC